MGVEIDANSTVLSPFAARLPQGGHAITTPFIVCCHLERKADDEALSEYLRVGAAGFCLMFAASARGAARSTD